VERRDWARAGLFGAGIVLGAVLGAGTALLLAPYSGAETRRVLRRSARNLGGRATDVWDELADELRFAARRGSRRVRRGVRRSREAARFWEP
jgi:gas vesicle protein